jgi:NHL repeat
MRRVITAVLLASTCGVAVAGEISFTSPPTAKRVGKKVVISFAVNRKTDVAIYIEDGKGNILRHLVAGVLGDSPPKPFKPGLSQSIEWDGKANYGKPAGAGPFNVRVALGLGAKYEKVVQGNRPFVRSARSVVACGKSVYVAGGVGESVFSNVNLIEYRPDGSYHRTLLPFPSNLPFARVKDFGALELAGKSMPAMHGVRLDLYAGGPPGVGMAVSPDGKHLAWVCAGSQYRSWKRTPPYRIGSIDSDGGSGQYMVELKTLDETDKGPFIMAHFGKSSGASLAFSSDGKHLYLCGIRAQKEKSIRPAIYKIPYPARNKNTLFFGDPKATGKDKEHLGLPWALATDGSGHLLVTDYGNNRVVVLSEKTGKCVSEFAVPQPQAICVDEKSGAIYVSSAKANSQTMKLIKYQNIKNPKKICESTIRTTGWGNHHSVAVTHNAEGRPVVWLATLDAAIVLFQDLGTKFSDARFVSRDVHHNRKKGVHKDVAYFESYNNVVIDRKRKEVYACVRGNGMRWVRYSEAEDKLEHVNWSAHEAGRDNGGLGLQIVPNPDGNLYSLSWPYCFKRWDRNGKALAFEHRIVPTMKTMQDHAVGKSYYNPKTIARLGKMSHYSFVPVSMTENPHTLGVRWSDGHIFIFSQTRRERTPKILREFLPNGKLISKEPIIWQISDTVVGPKFDAAGNIYVADAIKPKGWSLPPELVEGMKASGIKKMGKDPKTARHFDWRVTMAERSYGSIVKFSPKGGMVKYAKAPSAKMMSAKAYGNTALPAKPDLPETLKRIEAFYQQAHPYPPNRRGVTTIGAEWIHPGVGHMGPWRCNCESISFDVDEFGRSFFPDFSLYRIRVVDTAGNAVTHFGSYGNAECRGPESPVVDPKTGELRARKPGEKLKSPFAKPDIGLAWPIGVGVTDKFAYIGDSINRRLLKVRLTYETEKTCAVK